MTDFRQELSELLNRHSMEGASDTPDFILANFMTGCLRSFDEAVQSRENWYGRAREAGRTALDIPTGD